jgi:hypothetical protein
MTLNYPEYSGQTSRQPEATCEPAWALVTMVEQTILAKFTPSQTVTPAQVQAAQDLLERFYKERLATLALGHYAAAYGSHRCLPDTFEELSFRISALGIMQAKKEPTPDPAARQVPHSAADVVTNMRRLAEEQTRRRGTYLGQEIPPAPPENTR